ncbi:hypothetical protein H2199_004188 [Coniosporium tulheliwenetii]|uniref:Uncharacterized protein n=1 Tax=Coniosporium tulheliwenetii TaxID=3383036 RepID=A0ACC2Z842_9PEZI|nr:hypothetical protein H2199_004188 [Cladosporium sp. JES 115]
MTSGDFELYSSQDDYANLVATTHSYMPATSYADGSYLTTFDSYPSVHAYSSVSGSQEFHYSLNAPSHSIENMTPAGSPAHSMSYSFEAMPPMISTASESDASIQKPWTSFDHGLGGVGAHESLETSGFEYHALVPADKLGFVDPTLIQPFPSPLPYSAPSYPTSPYHEAYGLPSPHFPFIEQPPSPATSSTSNQAPSRQFKRSQSPFPQTIGWQPYPNHNGGRRPSLASIHSRHSQSSRRSGSFELDDEAREKGMCPIPECGRVFKDLKAHMLTHQKERPEKCPITTCEFHVKGFARKYDKNRHTLTHYKGTMVCGFCPGSGSAAEKSFNRADVFKRHLTSVHGVEQNPPNSRRKSPASAKRSYSTSPQTAAGTCSTCSVTFANAQEFYEHLDDCVLRVVQQADPSEAINQKLLSSVADDKDVKATMDRHCLTNETANFAPAFDEDTEESEELEDNDDENDASYGHAGSGITKPKTSGARGSGRAGLTYSKGGIGMSSAGRKKRKNYPPSWGCATDKMRMKKRVLCVYDGPRRLWKDDMMLDQEFEVRMKLPDGRNYVTDLDVQTLKRAEAMHGATDEERGPWRPDNVEEVDVEELMA